MGHSDIHTTMRYVELSPKDVFEEFHRVVAKISTETPPLKETVRSFLERSHAEA